MTHYILSVVEDAIAQSATSKHSECRAGDKCWNLIDRNWQTSLSRPARKEPCGKEDACCIGQSIPANTKLLGEMDGPRIEVIDPVVPLRRWKQIHVGVLYPRFQRTFGLIAAIESGPVFSAGSRALQILRAMR